MSTFGKVSGTIFWGAFAWLFVASLLALQFWPHVPHSKAAWVAFVAFGPPLYVLAEGTAEWFWSSRAGRALSRPSRPLRVVLGTLIVGFGCVFIWGMVWLASHP